MKKALIVIGSLAVAAVVVAKIIHDRLNRRTDVGYWAPAV